MSQLPPPIPRRADDDDDGTLDVYDVEALKARLRAAEETRTLSPTPTAVPHNAQFTFRSRPLPTQATSDAEPQTNPVGELERPEPEHPSNTGSTSRPRCDEKRKRETVQHANPTNAYGIPLLTESNASTSKFVPDVWNAFVSGVSKDAAPHAIALWQYMQRQPSSGEAEEATQDSSKPKRKRRRRRRQQPAV